MLHACQTTRRQFQEYRNLRAIYFFGGGWGEETFETREAVCRKLWRFRVAIAAVETQQCILFPPHPTLSHKRNCFRSEFIEDKVHVFIFSITFCKECLILRWIHRNIIINERRFSSGVPIILVRFESNLIFPYRFSNHPQILNFVYVRPVGAELFHPDGHTWLN